MGFDTDDRNMLIATHTMVKVQGEAIKELKEEDKVLHHRINKVRNLFGGITAAASAVVTGIVAYFKITKGD